jgi:eukaryotic-like serine/threonine-protein kinase
VLGTTLGHYRVIELLGAGGMGEVYRARDDRLERDVAIKVLPAATLDDEAARSRFRKEALALARLNHPNIGTVHDFNTQEGVDFLVMELVPGRSLADRLRGGPLPDREIAGLGAQVAAALEEAHEQGIVHRDLKPGNVMVTPKGQAKVLDFGLARLLLPGAEGDLTATLTGPHVVAGTVPYMAPEQLRGQPADARTDVWALGVVLYEMASGARPFQGQTGFELSSAILSQPPPPLPPHVPGWLRTVIERCLEKEPERRYQRAGELRAALETMRTGAAARTTGWQHLVTRRRWLAWAGAPLAAVAVLLALDAGGARTRIAGGPAEPRIQSLAVLPLENLSGDPAQDYFADGMTDTLITDLARLGGLRRVTARGSVMRYKGTTASFASIAQDLRVDALITGSVLRSGDRVSISAQLIDPVTEDQLWANRYERDLKDVISLGNDIVSAIVREIRVQLTPGEEARLASARPVNPEVYEATLRARFHMQRLTPGDFESAMEYCEAAVRIDPTDARGHLCVSRVAGAAAHMGFGSPTEAVRRVKESAQRAIELDPTLTEVYAHLGIWTVLLDWDWAAAEEHFEKAGELHSDSRVSRADLHMARGQREEALRQIRRALDEDPLNAWAQTAVGGRLLRLGRYEEGLALLEKAAAAQPSMGLVHRYLWTASHNRGRLDRALEAARRFLELLGHADVADAMQRGYEAGGYDRAMKVGADMLAERFGTTYVQPSEVARLYAYAGDADRAFAWLDTAYEARDTWMSFVNSDPRFDSLHADPRFGELLRRMNMSE